MLDTTKTAGKTTESAPQKTTEPGFDWLLIAAAALAVAILGTIAWTIAQNDEVPIDIDSMVSGFDYNTDATTGKPAAAGVTTQYFGHSDELYPEKDLVSGFDYNTDATSAQWAVPRQLRPYFGHSDELFPPKPVSGFDHNTDATTGKSAADGVTTPYFGFNPEFD